MRKSLFTNEQIIAILKEVEAGMPTKGCLQQVRHQRADALPNVVDAYIELQISGQHELGRGQSATHDAARKRSRARDSHSRIQDQQRVRMETLGSFFAQTWSRGTSSTALAGFEASQQIEHVARGKGRKGDGARGLVCMEQSVFPEYASRKPVPARSAQFWSLDVQMDSAYVEEAVCATHRRASCRSGKSRSRFLM
jgi:hypothetical protein